MRKNSPKQTEASRKNGAKGGPKTAAGKARSRGGARKSGVFSKELLVTEAERPEYDKIRNDLYRQLKPNTPAQEIAFENIITCTWRCVLALRLEGKRVKKLVADQTESGSEDNKPVSVQMVQWFASSRQNLRNAIRWMESLEKNLVLGNRLTEQEKEVMSGFFGPEFRQLLEQWPPLQSIEAMKLARKLIADKRNFNWPLPDLGIEDRPSDKNAKDKGSVRSVKDDGESQALVDTDLQMAFVLKLIQERRSALEDLGRFSEQSWVTAISSANNEFNPRFFASASRDLRRAFDWFLELKERDL
jgi:hypothetical protein